MIQRIHKSKNLVAFVLAAATGVTLYFRMPSPEGNIFLRVTALQSPFAVEVLKYSRTLFLFSTPYIGYSVVFSGLYILAGSRRSNESALANCLSFRRPLGKETVFSSSSERSSIPGNRSPPSARSWLVIPERGLFTGVATSWRTKPIQITTHGARSRKLKLNVIEGHPSATRRDQFSPHKEPSQEK